MTAPGMAQAEVFELFPTPVSRVPGVLTATEAAALAQRLAAQAVVGNDQSAQLAHSALLGPGEHPALDALVERLGPHVQAFGELLLGEALRWLVKEIWVNVLQPGGQQAVHNHANSFVSGVVYLTPSDDSARTVFLRGMGGSEFALRNTHRGTRVGAFNAEKWVAPPPAPGDVLLFPSYLLHQVPTNRGAARVTLAFNAIPHRLDAWGYTLSLSPG
ncbi:MAG TPA: TIGR02466 family protein [Ramlibacter sp.]